MTEKVHIQQLPKMCAAIRLQMCIQACKERTRQGYVILTAILQYNTQTISWLSLLLCLYYLVVLHFLQSIDFYFCVEVTSDMSKKAHSSSSFDCTLLLSLLFCITPHGVFMDRKPLKIIQSQFPWNPAFPSSLLSCACVY